MRIFELRSKPAMLAAFTAVWLSCWVGLGLLHNFDHALEPDLSAPHACVICPSLHQPATPTAEAGPHVAAPQRAVRIAFPVQAGTESTPALPSPADPRGPPALFS